MRFNPVAVCVVSCFALGLAVSLGGCREEIGGSQSQPAASTAPPPQDPIAGHVGQGGGSSLGAAKRSATNVVDQAEQKSAETAKQADEMFEND